MMKNQESHKLYSLGSNGFITTINSVIDSLSYVGLMTSRKKKLVTLDKRNGMTIIYPSDSNIPSLT
jgi:hypothetical protein